MIKLYKLIVVTAIMLTGVVLPVKTASASGERTFFVPIIPCRLFDTRHSVPPVKGRFEAGETRDFFIYGGGDEISEQGGSAACFIPPTSVAVHLNFTAVDPGGFGFLRAWPRGGSEPTATLMAWDGKSISNATAIEFNNDGDKDLTIKIYGGSTDLVGDVVGYYIQ